MNQVLRQDGPLDDAMIPPEAERSAKPLWAMSRREAEAQLRVQAGLPPIRRTWPWVLLAVCLAVAAAGGGYVWTNRAGSGEEAAMAEAAVVEASAVVKQLIPQEYAAIQPVTLERTTKVTGNLHPSQRAVLSAEVGGRVEAVAVRPGDRVREGDVLVRIDISTLSSDLELARMNAGATRVQLELAETQLERAESLSDRGVTTSAALDEARTQVQSLRANLAAQEEQVVAAELRLEKATVRAPFDGVVSTRDIETGQYVGVASTLLTLVDMTRMEMEAAAPAAAVAQIAPGDPVRIVVDGFAERIFSGEVERINPVATQGTRTVPVYIHIDNPDGVLAGGMFASGQIVTDRVEEALAIPAQALREDAAGSYVLTVADGRVERTAVAASGSWGRDLVRIVDGLSGEEVIVTAPLASLEPGDLVELIGS